MLQHIDGWFRARRRSGRNKGRWARWIGRGWARVHYGLRVEPTWLELTNCTIPIRELPKAFEGFRIAHLTDFHCSRHVTTAYIREAADLAQRQDADVIVLTGDFIHHGFDYIEPIAQALSQLSAPHGVYAVLGNHDYSVRNALGLRRHRHLHRAVSEELGGCGIRVLHNEAVSLWHNGAELFLVGVEDLWSRACDLESAFAGLAPDVPCIALAHNPRTVEQLEGRRCDLMLSGHTHGGQVRWRRAGHSGLLRPRRRFTAGLYSHERTQLYVNKGIGFGAVRFRYGVRPEVAILTLRSSVH